MNETVHDNSKLFEKMGRKAIGPYRKEGSQLPKG